MFDQLLLKTIGTRLVAAGNCPYDPHCTHAGQGSCMADKETLQEKEAKIKAGIKKEEPSSSIVYLTINTKERWPCETQAYVILLPSELAGNDPDD